MFSSKTFPVWIFLFSPALAAAQHSLDSIQRLEEVTVTADRYREVIPSQRLSGKRLEALSSFSVADAIRYFSGVQIKDYGGIGGLKTIDIRSMGTNHSGVFYDGIPLGNAQNGQIDLGKFSLDNIEEISLHNGQKSEIFQSAKDFGSAGAIYLRTRRPRFADGKNSNVVSRFRTGSFDLLNPSVLWEQKIGGSDRLHPVSASVNAEYIYSSGKYPFRYRKVLPGPTVAWDTTAVRQNGDIRSLRLESGLNGSTAQGYWQIKTYFYNSGKGIPGAIVNNIWKRSQRQWDRNFFIQSHFVETWRRLSVQTRLKYANDWMRYLNPDTTLMYIDHTFLQQEIYASLAGKYSVHQHWDVNLSLDYQWNTLSSTMKNFAFPSRNTVLSAWATAAAWRHWKAQASLLGTFVFENSTGVKDRQEFTPAVYLSFQPMKRHQLHFRAFYKRIFRMPTFNDLYYTDMGNISLRPEYTRQYNLGFQYDKPFQRGFIQKLNLRVDAYYNEVTDKIVAIPKGAGQYRWIMMNLGYVEIRGVDVSAQIECFGEGVARRVPSLNLGLNYTVQRSQDFTDPASPWYGGQIAYIPWHNGSAIAHIVWRSWDLNYSFIYVGERYHHSANILANYEQPWYTHDVTIAQSFRFGKVKARISAEVNNLFNQYYDVVLNYPMPGRNYKLIIKMEI